MATSRKGAPADDPEALRADSGEVGQWTDCAACGAALPEGNRYLCAACVEESGRRAVAIMEALQESAPAAPVDLADDTAGSDDEDAMACPTCGMRLDPSGRCAGCVTTVRR